MPNGRAPTPMQAVLLWVTAVLAAGLAGAAVLVLVSTVRASTGSGAPDAAPALDSALADPVWLAATTGLNELVLVGVLAAWILGPNIRCSLVLPLGRPTLRGTAGGLCLALGAAPVASAVGELTRRALGDEDTVLQAVGVAARSASPGKLLLLLLSLAVLPGVAEEAVFRGYVMRAFQRVSTVAAVGTSSVLFALLHLDPVQVAGTLPLGIAFGLARHYTGSVVPPMIAHGVYNAAVLFYVRLSTDPLTSRIDPIPILLGCLGSAAGIILLSRGSGVSRGRVADGSDGRP